MQPPREFVKISGSEKRPPAKAKILRSVDPGERIEVTLLLRRPPRQKLLAHEVSALRLGEQRVHERKYLTRQEFVDRLGADAGDVQKVEAFAKAHDLTVVSVNRGARTMKLSGPIGKLMQAFALDNMHEYEGPTGRFRSHAGAVSVPADLSEIVCGVFGLDSRPAVRPRAISGVQATSSFSAPQVASLYNFPQQLDGSGQCIAIIAINNVVDEKPAGGGFKSSDLQTYFKELKLPVPQVTSVSVDGGGNLPGPAPGFDSEITLDIEIAGATAPGAAIAVYFAPNTNQGFIDCVTTALHDSVRKPSVVSLSWGAEEDSNQELANGLHEALQDAVYLGVTVCVATGDLGSADLIPPEMDGKPHVDAPSSSPFALACGGTKLTVHGSEIVEEVVWNDGARSASSGSGGGGVSNLFARPSYQNGLTIPESSNGNNGRGSPDVAGHAATSAGYQVVIAGKHTTMGGTSAVAPLWAGLMARINQRLTQLGKPHAGFVNAILYQSPAAFREIVKGNNDLDGSLGLYNAAKGWNPCTGLGAPDGTKVMEALIS